MTDPFPSAPSAPVDALSCASVDGNCVHSPDALSWSAHNVLLVATPWAVFLHVKSLLAVEVAVRPVAPGAGTDVQQIISGAKWALHIAPEDSFPAMSRLCVRATRDLFVYRVFRSGTGRVRVSGGVCLCFHPNGASDGARNASRRAKRERNSSSHCVVAYEWFPHDLLVVVTRVGIFTFAFHGNTTDDAGMQQRQVADATPMFSFESHKGLEGISVSCATRVVRSGMDTLNEETLVVAAPYFLYLFSITSTSVHLRHRVEVSSLTGVPLVVCCIASGASIRTFISVPLRVLHGTFTHSHAQWNASGVWATGEDLGEDVAVRRFVPLLLHTLRSPLALSEESPTQRAVTAKTERPIEDVVLGMCQRRLVAFMGRRCVPLFTCMRHDGQHIVPSYAPLEMWGVAPHPSFALATLGLRFGRRYYPPMQLLSVAAGSAGGFLARVLQISLPQNPIPLEVESDGVQEMEMKGAGGVLSSLYSRQGSTSCFLWEDLLPQSTLPCEMAKLSGEVVQALRRLYLRWREEYGVELFLRFDKNGEEAVWYNTLLHIRRRNPDDRVATEELLLANAVQLMAAEVHYAGFNRVGKDAKAPYCFTAALQYGKLYHADCGEKTVAWTRQGPFGDKLEAFLKVVESKQHNVPTHFTCSVCGEEEQLPITMTLASFQPATSNASGESTPLHHKAKTPVSGVTKQKGARQSKKHPADDKNASGSTKCPDGAHYTVFSGKTFLPLSLLAENEVVSRCCSCVRKQGYVMLFKPRGVTSNDPKYAGNSCIMKLPDVLAYRDTWTKRLSEDFSLWQILQAARSEKNKPVVPEKLTMTENAFKVKDRESIDASERAVRTVQSTLNKLTESNFDVLVKPILTEEIILNPEVVSDVVRLIYEKALVEPVFAGLYARLCHQIAMFEFEYCSARGEQNAQKSKVRVAIVEKCQQMFDNARKVAPKSEEEAEKVRKRNVTNIKFAGELFLKSLITQRIIELILAEKLTTSPTDVDLEVVVNLLEVVGKMYEEKHPTVQPELWKKLGEMQENRQYSNRIRFLLQNLNDRRNDGWKPRETELLTVEETKPTPPQQQTSEAPPSSQSTHAPPSHPPHNPHHPHHHYPHHPRNNGQLLPPMNKRAMSYQDVSSSYSPGQRRVTSYSDLTGCNYAMPPPPTPPPTQGDKHGEEHLSEDEKKLMTLARPPDSLSREIRLNILSIARDAMQEGTPATEWSLTQMHQVAPGENEQGRCMTAVYVILLKAITAPEESEQSTFLTALTKGVWDKSVICRGFAWCLTEVVSERLVEDCPKIYARFVQAVVQIPDIDFINVAKEIIARTANYLDALIVLYECADEWEEDFIKLWEMLLSVWKKKHSVTKLSAEAVLEGVGSTRQRTFLQNITPDLVAAMVQSEFLTEEQVREWRRVNKSNPKLKHFIEELDQLYL